MNGRANGRTDGWIDVYICLRVLRLRSDRLKGLCVVCCVVYSSIIVYIYSVVEKIYRHFAAREDARTGDLLRNPSAFRIFEP